MAKAGVSPSSVIGIGTDFTASTPLPTPADGTPLCELPQFADRPHAYVKLWKHHAAQRQADRINVTARERGEAWLARYGGMISSEWEFAKALQLLEEDPEIYASMDRWVEAADWIVWQLCGTYVRNACTAGYKGIRQDGQYPSREYLAALNPEFADFVTEKLSQPIGQLGDQAGTLTARAADMTGLPEGIAVAVGNVDAHVTPPAANATRPEDTYRALLEATAYGTRTIIEAFTNSGVDVNELVVAGGLLKNPLLMQIYADVTRLPLSTIASEQGPALGSAIHAAVAADAYPDVTTAGATMGRSNEAVYQPDPQRADAYDALYAEYVTLHEHFGRAGNDVMHRLRDIRRMAITS